MKKKLFFSFCFLFFIGVISCSDDIASDKENETEQGADKEEGNGEPTTPITMAWTKRHRWTRWESAYCNISC